MKRRKRKCPVKEIVENRDRQPNAKERERAQVQRKGIFEESFQISNLRFQEIS